MLVSTFRQVSSDAGTFTSADTARASMVMLTNVVHGTLFMHIRGCGERNVGYQL